jgi:hypothetical protein
VCSRISSYSSAVSHLTSDSVIMVHPYGPLSETLLLFDVFAA